MKDLFLKKKPEIEKSAEIGNTYMSKDPTEWVQQVIAMFLQKFPYLQEQPVSVSWRKKNPDEGYAVGYVNVLNGAAPVIIRDFVLKPIDVLFTPDGIAVPLKNEFIKELMSDPSAFAGLKQTKSKANERLFNSALQFSPVTDYGSYDEDGDIRPAARTKISSVIDNISFVHKDDASKILKEVQKEDVGDVFEKNGSAEYFEKLVKKAKSNTKEAELEDYVRNLDIDRQMVYQNSKGDYLVKQANSKIDKTWETRITQVEASELDDIIANDVESKEEKTFKKEAQFENKLPSEGKVGRISDGNKTLPDDIEILSIEKLAEHRKVAEYNVLGDENKAIYFDSDQNWEITEKKAKFDPKNVELEGSEPTIGSYGSFVTEKTASKPFKVTGMQKGTRPGTFIIRGETALEKYAFYPVKSEMESFEPHDSGANGHFYVPKNAKFVKVANKEDEMSTLQNFEARIKIEGLNGFNKVAFYSTPDVDEITWDKDGEFYKIPTDATFNEKISDEVEKTANLESNLNKHEVYRDKAGFFGLRGPEFAKYAQNNPIRNLNKKEAKWALLHCGGVEKDIEKVASLNKNRSFEVNGEILSPNPLSKLDDKLNEFHDSLKGEGRLKIAKNLVKEASYIRDKRVVDAVLSLGLLRKKNVQEYLAILPTYETVLSELAKLLIASRMGLSNTSPEAIRNAMESMADVVLQLSQLKANLKEVN